MGDLPAIPLRTAAAICGILVGMEKRMRILYGVADYAEIRKAGCSMKEE